MRAAVIGAGRMGRRHIEVIRRLGLELVGVCDANPESLATANRESGVPVPLLFSEARALFETASPDCVVIATTAPSHCDLTCMAAESGASFVLCEKPMATSLADCDRMIAACAANETRLAVNHQMRFMEQYTTPKQLLESDAFGGLTSITVVAGNFGLSMNGSHYFEMVRFMMSEPVVGISAWLSSGLVPNPRGPNFEDRAGSVRAETESGRRFYMEIGDDQGYGVLSIYGARYGQIVVDELSGTMRLTFREEQHRQLPTTRYGMPAVSETRQIAPADAVTPSQAVLSALLAGEDYPSGEDGRLAVASVVAAHLSDEQMHRAVSPTDSELPRERSFPWA